jgi:hypothetical protein
LALLLILSPGCEWTARRREELNVGALFDPELAFSQAIDRGLVVDYDLVGG